MKKFLFLILTFILGVTGTNTAQETTISASTSEANVLDPEKLFNFILIGLGISFILFIIFALSRATSALSNSLGEKYMAGKH